ncbi:MAG: hypothetical protein K0S04_3796 [Herbinix sp.]|jgi:uncharacterized protein YrzB (UPF0473 family)|nr:hypothetical protein [Herbinix sp.]
MENNQEEIKFTTEDGEEVAFYVLEQTRLGGVNYILVSTTDEEEAEALILKDVSKDTDEEAIYDIVEDDQELELVAGIFKELLDDVELY